jgi:natural product biosynthesis luciferase-like monooxygenase protein
MKNVADIYHLTPVQREMLSDAHSAIVQIGWKLDGELDSDAFERAGQQVMTRHAALRTGFLAEQLAEPVQVVRQQVKLSYERHDLIGDTPEQQQQKLQELLFADSLRGFDPARPPLFRLTEVRCAARVFQFILSHHPLLIDDRSADLMLGEVLTCYRAAQQNSECSLAPAPAYHDYVGWVERQDLAGAEIYWRKSLDLNATRQSLTGSTNGAGARVATVSRVSRRASFRAAATEALKTFALRQQISVETLIAAAWSLTLMRERKCSEVNIGVVVRKRPSGLPGSEQMIGLLQNTLPLSLSFEQDEPISSWLQKVERKRANLQKYAHISRAQIKRWLDVGQELPLCDSVVLFHESSAFADAEPGTTGLTIGEVVRYSDAAPFVLAAVLDEELSLTLQAGRDEDEPVVTRLLESLQNTLDHLTFPALYLAKSSVPAPGGVQVASARSRSNGARNGTHNGAQNGVQVTSGTHAQQTQKPLDFSLFYFADDNAVYGEDKYRLYREGAKFADRNQFAAVWTPERHFHEKAGLYPNPSVLSAALATITEHIQLRAGSVVLPLHNSLRVAEEWSVVDNLSKGRVGVSFTSGWMPNDFAFFPERYVVKREEMFRGIQEVQDLWRGKPIAGRDGLGKDIELRIFPKPIRAELPIWLTCSGGPEMFEKAGELGCHVLTALLTQSIEEVAPKIKLYRDAMARHGHDPADGKVTMMMHTFIGEDAPAVLDKVKAPLTNYLKSHLSLIETGAQSLNLQVDISEADYREKYQDQMAAFAFERYYRTSSLIGTPTSCMKMVERLKAIGVDEVACLIDFGVDVDSVMESLSHLAVLKNLSDAAGQPEMELAQVTTN